MKDLEITDLSMYRNVNIKYKRTCIPFLWRSIRCEHQDSTLTATVNDKWKYDITLNESGTPTGLTILSPTDDRVIDRYAQENAFNSYISHAKLAELVVDSPMFDEVVEWANKQDNKLRFSFGR
jgi:hypothetical protein